ncbi:MAG: ABC transporter ATP-binding protein [Puniceicoccales bacterium]|jgi:ABC-2 type transport system ATP-binding protein|nr:ABC transporter ATP-binding protein [Puniceicoccales bacterium]
MGAAIVVENLTRRFGKKVAIDALSFSIAPGEIVGFLGPNGAGKTTTLRILAGLIDATSGTAFLGNFSISRRGHCPSRLFAYMAENNPLPDRLTVWEYLQLRAQLKNVPDVRREVTQILQACDLLYRARRCVIGKLSRGHRQRVGLADALLGRPQILLLDEPTMGLDPRQARDLRQLLRRLPDAPTIFFSSHVLGEVEAFCPRVLILSGGKLIADGFPEALRHRMLPRSPQRWHGHSRRLVQDGGSLEKQLRTLPGILEVDLRRDLEEFHYTVSIGEGGGLAAALCLFGSSSEERLLSWERESSPLEDVFLAATEEGNTP